MAQRIFFFAGFLAAAAVAWQSHTVRDTIAALILFLALAIPLAMAVITVYYAGVAARWVLRAVKKGITAIPEFPAVQFLRPALLPFGISRHGAKSSSPEN